MLKIREERRNPGNTKAADGRKTEAEKTAFFRV
jgi:hypothetical protein